MRKMVEGIGQKLQIKLHCQIDDHFKAERKGGYSFEYLNMAANCFPLKPAFSNKHGFGD